MGDSHTRQLRIALITLGDSNTLTGGYLYHKRLAALAPRYSAQVEFVSFPDKAFPLALVDAREVLRSAYRMRADALVLDSIAAAFAGPWLAFHRPEVPLVGMLHQPPGGIDHGRLRTRLQARLDRLAYRRTNPLMVASESLRDQLIAQGMPPTRLCVVPPGRDQQSATGNRQLALVASGQEAQLFTSGDLRCGRRASVLCVANWMERKGILSLLEAFSRLPGETATLHLVGDNRTDRRYVAKVRERLGRHDLAGRVVVHGPLAPWTVAALYAAADVFALPSTKEPYGTVFGEAMVAGLPVVGWRAGNLPYLAEDGQEGLLVEVGDISELARALSKLSLDPNLRSRMANAARLRAQSFPTWEETASLFFSTVRKVAAAS